MTLQGTEPLAGRRILLVEDEYFLADDLRRALLKSGASLAGPFGDVEEALAAIEKDQNYSCAVLDINLRGRSVWPVADALIRLDVPFLFTTGYDKAAIPQPYRNVPICEKPVDVGEVIRLLMKM